MNYEYMKNAQKIQEYVTNMRPAFNKRAVFSDETENYRTPFEPEPGDVVNVRIRTKKNNVDLVYLVYEDKKKVMDLADSRDGFDYYEANIPLGTETVRYYFEIYTGKLSCFYNRMGVVREIDPHYSFGIVPGFKTPEWAKGAVMYQIFVDRFCNGDASNDVVTGEYCYIDEHVQRVEDWYRWPQAMDVRDFYGGDLQGVWDKLDYLQGLGVDVIYFNPIFVSPSNHKYDTTDYEKIDSHFGDDETMKRFVDEAHKRGIRVMLDAVFNHSGYFFKPWQDVLKNGRDSEYFDWFMINDWPLSNQWDAAKRGQLYTFAFFDEMPKLNTNNQAVRNYLIGVACGWVKKYDVDGLRMDVANEVSHVFCKQLRMALKSIKPEIYILGEVWHDAIPWLRGDEFDSVMNYPLAGSMKDFFLDKSLTGEDFEFMVNRCYTNYMQQTNDVLFNMLDSHDTIRLRNVTSGLDMYNCLFALLFTMPGSTCIYYGTEIGMEGSFDPDCRRCMPWGDIEQGKYNEQISITKQLIKLRKEEPLMRERNFHFPAEYKNPRVIQFQKMGWGETLEVIVNSSDEDIEVIKDEDSKIMFSRKLEGDVLHMNGVCIRYLSNKQNI